MLILFINGESTTNFSTIYGDIADFSFNYMWKKLQEFINFKGYNINNIYRNESSDFAYNDPTPHSGFNEVLRWAFLLPKKTF